MGAVARASTILIGEEKLSNISVELVAAIAR